MRRRELVLLLGGAMMTARPLCAQQKAMPVIGFLSSKTPTAEAGVVNAIRQALAEAGFVEGRNVAITYDWSEGNYDRLPGLAAAIVRNSAFACASGTPVFTRAIPCTQ